MTAPAWLAAALAACWLACSGCGPADLSLRFGPVEDGPAEDSRWDWQVVIHHAREGCPVLDDPAAMADLGDALTAELAGHIVLAEYGEPCPLHTAVAAP